MHQILIGAVGSSDLQSSRSPGNHGGCLLGLSPSPVGFDIIFQKTVSELSSTVGHLDTISVFGGLQTCLVVEKTSIIPRDLLLVIGEVGSSLVGLSLNLCS